MKVYVACCDVDYEPGEILGVFSDPLIAEYHLVDCALKYYFDDVYVWETELDKGVYK